MSKQKRQTDPEVLALKRVGVILDSLPGPASERVARWAASRWAAFAARCQHPGFGTTLDPAESRHEDSTPPAQAQPQAPAADGR